MEDLQAGNGKKKRPKRKLKLKKIAKHISAKQTNKQIVSVVVNNLIQGISKRKRKKKSPAKPPSQPKQSPIDNAIDRQLATYMKFLGYTQQEMLENKVQTLRRELKKLEDDKKREVLAQLKATSAPQIEHKIENALEYNPSQQERLRMLSEQGRQRLQFEKARNVPLPEEEKVEVEDVTELYDDRDKIQKKIAKLHEQEDELREKRGKLKSKDPDYTRITSQLQRLKTDIQNKKNDLEKIEKNISRAEGEESESEQSGGFKKLLKRLEREGGLYNSDIEEVMKDSPHWGGVIACDEFDKIPAKPNLNLVVNLDKASQPGSHWVSIRVDSKDRSVEYYDSFGRKPPDTIDKGIKDLFDRIEPAPSNMFKYKYNRKPTQNPTTDTCGYHAMLFILQRNRGDTFKKATNFDEDDVEDAKIKGTFDYI